MKEALPGTWLLVGAMAHELGLRQDETQRLISLLQGFGLRAVQLGFHCSKRSWHKRSRSHGGVANWKPLLCPLLPY